jgi:lipopolysaccharide export system protein LptA
MRRARSTAKLGRRLAALGLSCLLAGSLAVPALAAPPPASAPIIIEADHIEYNTQTGEVVADGHVRARQADLSLAADHLRGNLKTNEVTADGHVHATRGDLTITADHLEGNLITGDVLGSGHVVLKQGNKTATGSSLRFNYRTRAGQIEQVVSEYGPWHMTGATMETTGTRDTAYQTSITPCDPKHPAFLVTARKVVVVPGDYMTAYNASLYVAGTRVVTVPVYTVSLKRGAQQSRPTVGYTNIDGLFLEYRQFFVLAPDLTDQLRLRYGTISDFTFEDILNLREADHLWSLHLGREEVYNVNGTLVNVDRDSVSLIYDTRRVPGLPLRYTLAADLGAYAEPSVGAATGRASGIVTLVADPVKLSPTLTFNTAGSAAYDTYGTGQQQTIAHFAAALSNVLSHVSSASLSYNLIDVAGSTPFDFDAVNPANAVSLGYSYYPGKGFLRSALGVFSYSFIRTQTITGLNVGVSIGGSATMAISKSLLFTVSPSYNVTIHQFNEIDFAVNARCDCVALGLLYKTFPQNPSQNTIFVTIGLSEFPGAATTMQF